MSAPSNPNWRRLDVDADDWAAFRDQLRALLLAEIPPEQVVFDVRDAGATRDLWAAAAEPSAAYLESSPATPAGQPATQPITAMQPVATPSPQLPISARLIDMLAQVFLHSDPDRFWLIYRLLWRWLRDPVLRGDPLDPEMRRALAMAQAVHREVHHMKGFVRFRVLPADPSDPGPPWQVAWFEPRYRSLLPAAAFFVRRFRNLRWRIMTPAASVWWDGHALHHGPGESRHLLPPPDASETLWLTYYSQTFNPARLNMQCMQRHMPQHYWRNLPEAQCIDWLARTAAERTAHMLDAAPPPPSARAAKGRCAKK